MKAKFKHFITINNTKYFYTITKSSNKTTHFECQAANISQDFPNEDIADLIIDLPNLIVSEKEYQKNKQSIIRFRINNEDKAKIEEKAVKKGYKSISSYLRDLALS